ncbi:MAG: hypothetical protein E6K73_13450 [Candidatus Eisenbacteria bacterium]|uniref:FlgD/Vpr Ig-like domain-containing protein n=1 Tax=Eiseniibacteriota bacterium TaxID=2212470 RepID=A0A538S875_UNCEI|nr:MAG: hypothetical protein E6K73_13450 [Candidatus Eisenbacteria bacterium]
MSPDASAANRPAGSGLTLLVVSPQRVGATDFALTLDGTNQPYLALPAGADTSGREWVVTWDHAAYAAGSHRVELEVATVDAPSHTFRVELKTRLENVVAFPNPFDDELGVRFSFYLVSTAPADVLLRVFTVSGRLVYERHEHALDPVYHQLAWDGLDAEGQKLANGIYFFKLLARNSSGSTVYEGRLVKLRKPRRAAPETETP